MNIKLTVPPKLVEQIVEELFEKLWPLFNDCKRKSRKGELIYDVPRLAKYLRVSTKWVYEQTHLKTIPHFKMGGKQLRFRRKEIDQWLNDKKVPAASILCIKAKKL
jgi:excisionase family DNA binding protein